MQRAGAVTVPRVDRALLVGGEVLEQREVAALDRLVQRLGPLHAGARLEQQLAQLEVA